MIYAIVAVLILILDQGMKYYTTGTLPVGTAVKELVPGFLQLRNVHNSGSAFSFLNGWPYARWLFLGVTLVFAVLVILALSNRWIKGGFGRWMALFILAGALGNGIDRCIYGYVVDMFEFAFKLPLVGSFPVFNVADVFITCGAIAFCLYVLFHKERSEETKAYGHVRRGPGGSVTTRPAPKPKAKPEPEPAAAERAARKPAEKAAAAAEPETARPAAGRREAPKREAGRREAPRGGRRVAERTSFTEETKRRPGEDPFAEWMEKGEEKAEAEAARSVTPAAPSAGADRAVTLDLPQKPKQASVTLDIPAPAPSGVYDNPFKKPGEPGQVTLDISQKPKQASVTLDIPAATPSTVHENPFKEPGESKPVTLDIPQKAGQKAVTLGIPGAAAAAPKPAGEAVTLDIPGAAAAAPKPTGEAVTLDIPGAAPAAEPKAARKPVTLDIPAAAAAPKPVTLESVKPAAPAAAAPKPEAIPAPIVPDTKDDEEFTLEDILNEFRDL